MKAGEVGEVEIDPNSRVQLVEARNDTHRIELARGRLSAMIWAPPRLFFVETPSATAIDLGCAYTLEVDDAGASLLRVTIGYVSLVAAGREAYIPAGAVCETRPRLGPGTPHYADAAPAFRQALRRFDFEPNSDPEALPTILQAAREEDALTLWHLLLRTDAAARSLVYERLARLVPPPSGVTRAGILAGNQTMMDAWWRRMGFYVMRQQ